MSAQTNGKIPKLVDEPLDPLTAVFLVNAIYFKEKWRYPFKAEHTYAGTFRVSEEETVKCDMMMLTENTENIRIGNSDQLDCQLAELPYEGIEIFSGTGDDEIQGAWAVTAKFVLG